MNHSGKKGDGSFLFELETVADAIARVDQDPKAQRQIGLRIELEETLQLLVVNDFEIGLGEVGDEATPAISHRKQQVHTGYIY
jgi:hypothetical protein